MTAKSSPPSKGRRWTWCAWQALCASSARFLCGPFPAASSTSTRLFFPRFPDSTRRNRRSITASNSRGCTVHIVDEGMDTGPIVLQAVVPVLDDDTVETLSARILKEEHRIYSEAVCLMIEDKVRIEGRRTVLLP